MDAGDALILAYLQAHPVEAARRLEGLPPDEAAALLRPFEAPDIAQVLEHLLPDTGGLLLRHLGEQAAAGVLSHVISSAATGMLRQCQPEFQAAVLDRLAPDVSPTIRRALTYPEHTAGSLADPQILTLTPDTTVRDALGRVARDHRRATYYLYVLDRAARLSGVVSLKQLLAAEEADLVGTIMSTKLVSLSASSTIEELLTHPNWRVFHTMPVVDGAGGFLGALRYRTIRTLENNTASQDHAASLSGSLLALWEAYSLAGIKVMTDLAEAITPPLAEPPGPTDRNSQP